MRSTFAPVALAASAVTSAGIAAAPAHVASKRPLIPRLLVLVIAAVIASTASVSNAQAAAPNANGTAETLSSTAAASKTSLPYTVAPVASSTKKVFAHYFPPYAISLDNKDPAVDYYTRNYLSPSGEGGKLAAVGGLLRDRPLPRATISGDYRLADAMTEVRQASDAGIDGFMINIMNWSGTNWDRTMMLRAAAAKTGNGFVTVPNIDASSGAVNASIPAIAGRLNEFYSAPGAYRLPDGRYMLSSFKAEGKPATWWRSITSEVERVYGKKIAFVGVFNSFSETQIKEYAPISYALSVWGLRTPAGVKSFPDRAGQVRKAGAKWMAPIAVQDVRHRVMRYSESNNTETLRATWSRAIADKADMVQMITWNDYSESTQFAPSQAHGRAFLDLNGYYAASYKRGAAPKVTGDEVILSHRIQSYKTKPTAQSGAMDWTMNGTGTAPRDMIEVVTMLKAPAKIVVRAGRNKYITTYTAPAGLSTKAVALHTGNISVRLLRGADTLATVKSPYKVLSEVTRWDLQYYATSSRTS